MSQTVGIVAGDDVTGESLQEIFDSFIKPGIFKGFTINVAGPTTITVSAGSGMFDSGVFIFETQISNAITLPLTGGAQSLTVLYQYTPSNTLGGTPAVLTVQNGLVNPDTLVGGLVLGWIILPTSGLLTQSCVIPGRQFTLGTSLQKQDNNFVAQFAPFSTKWAQVSGVNLNLTEGWNSLYNAILTVVSNTTGSIQNVVYYYPILIPSTGLGQILLDIEVPNTASLVVSFIDTSNVVYQPSDNSWNFISTGAGVMTREILSVPQSVALATGQMAFIGLSMTMQSGSFTKFRTIGYSSYTEPF